MHAQDIVEKAQAEYIPEAEITEAGDILHVFANGEALIPTG